MARRRSAVLAVCILTLVACSGAPPEPAEMPDGDAVETKAGPDPNAYVKPSPGLIADEEPESAGETPAAPPTAAQELDGKASFDDADVLAAVDARWKTTKDKTGSLFLETAVRRGLFQNGIGSKRALALADEKHGRLWVGKCPICDTVRGALRAHAKKVGVDDLRQPKEGGVLERLESDDQKVRHLALQEMVAVFVQRAWTELDVPEDEMRRLKGELNDDKKRGMSGKPSTFDHCPSCEGANSVDNIL